jgi:hypothetical protein
MEEEKEAAGNEVDTKEQFDDDELNFLSAWRISLEKCGNERVTRGIDAEEYQDGAGLGNWEEYA